MYLLACSWLERERPSSLPFIHHSPYHSESTMIKPLFFAYFVLSFRLYPTLHLPLGLHNSSKPRHIPEA